MVRKSHGSYQMSRMSDYLRYMRLYTKMVAFTWIWIISFWNHWMKMPYTMFYSSKASAIRVAVHFEPKHWLINEVIKFLAIEYDPEDYFWHGSTVLTKTYIKLCHDKHKLGEEQSSDYVKKANDELTREITKTRCESYV